MTNSTLASKLLTALAVLTTLGVLGWVKWMWLKRWWAVVNHQLDPTAANTAGKHHQG